MNNYPLTTLLTLWNHLNTGILLLDTPHPQLYDRKNLFRRWTPSTDTSDNIPLRTKHKFFIEKFVCMRERLEFNGKTFGTWHGHLDHQTSLARSVCCRQRGEYGHTALRLVWAGSWSAHQRTSGSRLRGPWRWLICRNGISFPDFHIIR